MPYTPIIGTLGYVFDHTARSVLLVHRNKRSGDEHLGKWNGLGGKLEPGEDLASGMRRELLEEAHIVVTSMRLRGTISWPGVGKFKISWIWFAQDDARRRYLLREPETVVAPEATQLNHGRAWLKPFQDSAEDEFLLGLMVATQLLNDAAHPVAVVAPVLNLHAVEHPLP